uniref:UBC core domain-containing protein n=2 Tax=Ditylum brightwellii TaxID=49249 RepID=A0A7S4QRC8_9STRA
MFLSLITTGQIKPCATTGSPKVSATSVETQMKPNKDNRKTDAISTSTLKAGVGYETGNRRSTSDLVNKMEAAEKKQQALDETCCSLLKELSTFLKNFTGDEGIVLLSLKMSRGLNRMLFSILKNVSFLDLDSRSDVYLSTLEFIDTIGSLKFLSSFLLHDLLEGDGTGHTEGENSCETMLTTLCRQADKLRKSQEKILNDACVSETSKRKAISDEENVARGIVIVCDKMKKTLDNMAIAIQLGRQLGLISEKVDKAFVMTEIMPPNTKTDSEGIPLVEKEEYCKALGESRLEFVQMLELIDKKEITYHYHGLVDKEAKTACVHQKRMLRIHTEVTGLQQDLPVEWESSIFVRVDEDRPDVMKACIIAPEGTPYANGVFEFDIKLPDKYPDEPPSVQFMTTNQNKTRFNPNLYSNGKVCLSLLGTWEGPGWIPKTSTVLQVLISIQSLIFVPDPYFNEPGYSPSSDDQKRHSVVYDHQIRAATMKFAILEQLKNPSKIFRDCIINHFRLKKHRILKQIEEWKNEAKGCKLDWQKERLVAGGGIKPIDKDVSEICSKIEDYLKK